jgi:hypothetical protein
MKTKKKTTEAKKVAKPTQAGVRSKIARAHIAEVTQLFALAVRPTKAQFIKVYGLQGPKMTWDQRAKEGVDVSRPRSLLLATSIRRRHALGATNACPVMGCRTAARCV